MNWSNFIPHLTHWDWVTYIYASKLTIIGSGNDLSPGRCQAIIWTSAEPCELGPVSILQWNFNRNSNICIQKNAMENVLCQNGGHFVQVFFAASMCLWTWDYLSMLVLRLIHINKSSPKYLRIYSDINAVRPTATNVFFTSFVDTNAYVTCDE